MYMCVNSAVGFQLGSDSPAAPGAPPGLLQSAQGWALHCSAVLGAGTGPGPTLGFSSSGSRPLQVEQPLAPPVQVNEPGWCRSVTDTLELKMREGFARRSFRVCWPELRDEVLHPQLHPHLSAAAQDSSAPLSLMACRWICSVSCPVHAQALLQTQSCSLSKHLGLLKGKSLPCSFSSQLCVCVALVCLCSEKKKKSLKCLLTPAQVRETL